MIFKSTRGIAPDKNAAGAIIQGIASDKGLYVPESFPRLAKSWEEYSAMDYKSLAYEVLKPYLDEYTEEELKACIEGAYTNKFQAEEVVPVVHAGGADFLELYHGPTAAFKDMALALMPYMMVEAIKKENENKTVCILVSTSGDTGMAALKGFEDVPGTCIIVFFPDGAVSPVQERQMRTATGSNTYVYSIFGNFDDAQTTQKAILNDKEFGEEMGKLGYRFSAANSMNVGRLLPQVAYYVWAYAQMVKNGRVKAGDPINICVPSGNFGNILSAYYAKQMGVPVNKLICASNKNKVLTDFFETGVYDANREFFVTNSPSMDIIISSNLERLLYHLCGGKADTVRELMDALASGKKYEATAEIKEGLKDFCAGYATEEEILATIGKVFKEDGYVMDTHTAVAYKVYSDYREKTGDETPAVIASTASPYKFAASVCDACGFPKAETEFEAIEVLSREGGLPVHYGLKDLESRKLLHTKAIERAEMKDQVRSVIVERTK
ncbi:MAG: threonine synthase [Clostridia bacterium]|nr:threonine synthase [Clostridia bacterium]